MKRIAVALATTAGLVWAARQLRRRVPKDLEARLWRYLWLPPT